jgi:hypothetical protein
MCIKCAQTHLRASVISKKFPGLYPGLPLKGEGLPEEEWEGRGGGRGEKGKRHRRRGKWRERSAHPEMSDLTPCSRKSWINPCFLRFDDSSSGGPTCDGPRFDASPLGVSR